MVYNILGVFSIVFGARGVLTWGKDYSGEWCPEKLSIWPRKIRGLTDLTWFLQELYWGAVKELSLSCHIMGI